MSRIRTIKPEFVQSETVGALSRDARLLFIQLWTICDDSGRARAASRMLASLLYPYDDDAPKLLGKWLAELERAGCIRLYEVDGSKYLDIPNWLKHQRIDRPSPSRLPAFDEASSKPREESRALDADLGPVPRTCTSTLDHSCAVADATRTSAKEISEEFWEFWKAYPKRDGANPRRPAEKQFKAALKAGATPEEIIAGARACAARDRDKIGTPYIPQAVKWLRDQRWRDYAAAPAAAGPPAGKRSAAEILGELQRERSNGRAGKGDQLVQASPVDEDGPRACEDEPELLRPERRVAGVRPLAEILPGLELGTGDVRGADTDRPSEK